VVRDWFAAVGLARTPHGIELTPRLTATDKLDPTTTVQIDAPSWRITLRELGVVRRRGDRWSDREIILALQEWARDHDRAPKSLDWDTSTVSHPHAQTVFQHFGRWPAALRAAHLQNAPRALLYGYRSNEQIIRDLKAWTRRHRHPPRFDDWKRATNEHAAACTVVKRFGRWSTALREAGLPTTVMIRNKGKIVRATWSQPGTD
jgi:hypothetical protein